MQVLKGGMNMNEIENIIQAIPGIWQELPDLVGDEWEKFREGLLHQIEKLNDKADDLQTVATEISRQFANQPKARERLLDELLIISSEKKTKGEISFSQLPGTISIINTSDYSCLECNHVWSRRSVGQPVPKCPNCHIPLIPVKGN